MIQEELGRKTQKAMDKAAEKTVVYSFRSMKFGLKSVGKAILWLWKYGTKTGKQKLKNLIKDGSKVERLDKEVTDGALQYFTPYFKKYHVDYAVVRDKNTEPPTYHLFFKAKDVATIDYCLKKGIAEWEKDGKPDQRKREPIQEKLKRFKAKSKQMEKESREKAKEKGEKEAGFSK